MSAKQNTLWKLAHTVPVRQQMSFDEIHLFHSIRGDLEGMSAE